MVLHSPSLPQSPLLAWLSTPLRLFLRCSSGRVIAPWFLIQNQQILWSLGIGEELLCWCSLLHVNQWICFSDFDRSLSEMFCALRHYLVGLHFMLDCQICARLALFSLCFDMLWEVFFEQRPLHRDESVPLQPDLQISGLWFEKLCRRAVTLWVLSFLVLILFWFCIQFLLSSPLLSLPLSSPFVLTAFAFQFLFHGFWVFVRLLLLRVQRVDQCPFLLLLISARKIGYSGSCIICVILLICLLSKQISSTKTNLLKFLHLSLSL